MNVSPFSENEISPSFLSPYSCRETAAVGAACNLLSLLCNVNVSAPFSSISFSKAPQRQERCPPTHTHTFAFILCSLLSPTHCGNSPTSPAACGHQHPHLISVHSRTSEEVSLQGLSTWAYVSSFQHPQKCLWISWTYRY